MILNNVLVNQIIDIEDNVLDNIKQSIDKYLVNNKKLVSLNKKKGKLIQEQRTIEENFGEILKNVVLNSGHQDKLDKMLEDVDKSNNTVITIKIDNVDYQLTATSWRDETVYRIHKDGKQIIATTE